MIKDRNYFIKTIGKWKHCNRIRMDIDDVAKKCVKLLNYYSFRHYEVVRSTHMDSIRKYNFYSNNKLKFNIVCLTHNSLLSLVKNTKLKYNIII